MGETGKIALWAFVYISVWTVCSARFRVRDFDEVQKNGYRNGLHSSEEKTRWLVHPTIHTSESTAETSQALVIDPPKDIDDVKSFLPNDGSNKEYHSALINSDAAISASFANIQNIEKPLLVKDRSRFINSKNVIAMSDPEEGTNLFLTTSNTENVIPEHRTLELLSPGTYMTKDHENKLSIIHSTTKGDNVADNHIVASSLIKLTSTDETTPVDLRLLEAEDLNHIKDDELKIINKFDLVKDKPQLTTQVEYLNTGVVNERSRRNTQGEHSPMAENEKVNENMQDEHSLMETGEKVTDNKIIRDNNFDHFVTDNKGIDESKMNSSVDYNTKTSDVTDKIADEINDKERKVNNDNLAESNVNEKFPEKNDDDYQTQATDLTLHLENNTTEVESASMKADVILGDVTQSTMFTNSVDANTTHLNAVADISSDVPSLLESTSPATTPPPLSMETTQSVFTNGFTDVSYSSEMTSVHSPYQENMKYSEITTVSFENSDLYRETLVAETSVLTVESDLTSSDPDYINLDPKVSTSTPFIIVTTDGNTSDEHTTDVKTEDITDFYTTNVHVHDVDTTDNLITTLAHSIDVTNSHTTDVNITHIHSNDVKTTNAHIKYDDNRYIHTTDIDTTNIHITVPQTANLDTTHVHSVDLQPTDVYPITINTQMKHESTSSELTSGSNHISSSIDSLNTNSLTTPSVNVNGNQQNLDHTSALFPTKIADADIVPDNGSVSETKSEDEKFPLSVAALDWRLTNETWHFSLEIHIYAFGSLFGLLGIYTAMSFIRLSWIHCLFPRGYFIPVHVLVVFLCTTRSFYLLFDGYGASDRLHASLSHFLYSVSFPCMTSAFGLLFYSILRTTQVQFVSPSIQKIQVLVFLIVVHFLISMTADVLVGLYADMQVVQFVCHVYFITWGLFLFIGYFWCFHKLRYHAMKHNNGGIYTSPCSNNGKMKNSLTLDAAVNAMLCAALCGTIVVIMEVFAIIRIYKTFTGGSPEPWTWWFYHTVLRTMELIVYFILSYVVSLPLRYRRSKNKCSCGVFCAPCSEICCCGYNLNNPNILANYDHGEQMHNSTYNENGDNLTENSSKKLLYNHPIPTFDIQPTFGLRPNSLLIVEDGYVRFQTDCDINRIVDSCNDLSQRPTEVNNVSTFLLRDGCVNTGYSIHCREETSNNNNRGNEITEKSRNSSVTNSDFFRVPSSVSLADSMENELSKAFESFMMDDNNKDYKNNGKSNLVEVSNLQHSQETDLVSVISNPESGTKSNIATYNQSKPNYESDEAHRINDSTRQLVTLPRITKSPNVSRALKDRDFLSDSNMQQKHRPCFKNDNKTFNIAKNSPSSRYFCQSDNYITETQKLSSEDGELDSDTEFHVPIRRPSEGQGSQAAVLTSLLKSWESASNENIDV